MPNKIQIHFRLAGLLAGLLLLAGAGCGGGRESVPSIPGDTELARFGDRPVSVREMMIAFQEQTGFDGLMGGKPVVEATKMVEEASNTIRLLTANLAFDRYLAEQARALELEKKPNMQAFRADVVRDELYQKVILEDVLKNLNVSEEEIRQYYEENRSSIFLIKDSNVYIVRSIYIYKKNKPEDARRRIEEAQQRIKKGENFETVALEYSEAPSPLRGKPSQLPVSSITPENAERLAALHDGQYSDIIETEDRYFLLQRVEFREPKYVPYETAGDLIRVKLTDEKKQRALFQLLDRLTQKHTLIINADLLAKAEVEDATVLTVPGVYELSLREFRNLIPSGQSLEEKQEFLNKLGQKALYLAEAYSRGWNEQTVAPAVEFWFAKRLAEEYIRAQLGTISEEEIQKTYLENKKSPLFHTPALYDISRLLFRVPSTLTLSRYEQMARFQQAEQRAKEAVQALRDGRSFEDVVVLYSQDPNAASTGGDLGRKALDELDAHVQAILSPMQAGEISSPQKVDIVSKDLYGYEIFHVRDIIPPKPLSYEEAHSLIGRLYAQNQYEQKYKQYREDFDKTYPAQYRPEVQRQAAEYLAALSKRPDDQSQIAQYEEPRDRDASQP